VGKVRVRKETGKLFLDFYYQGVRCREQTALSDTAVNRRTAERLLDRIEQEIHAGVFDYGHTFPGSARAIEFSGLGGVQQESINRPAGRAGINYSPSPRPRFRVFAATWLREKTPECRPSYLETITVTLNKYVLPEFGNQFVDEITKADLLSFRVDLSETYLANGKRLSNARINKVMGFTRQILDEAADRYGFTTPYRNIKPLRSSPPDIQPFSLDEVNLIINRVRADYRNYMIVRFYTGMRTSEIHGLRWQNVDFDNRLILVRETLVQDKLMEGGKTPGSIRDIPMLPPVYEALLAQRKQVPPETDWVFCSPNGSAIRNQNFTSRVWRPLLANLGLEYRRPYQTRHTAATLMLAAGESPEWVVKVLGHSNTQMLFTVYSRYVPNLTRQDGSAIARLLAQQNRRPIDDGDAEGGKVQ